MLAYCTPCDNVTRDEKDKTFLHKEQGVNLLTQLVRKYLHAYQLSQMNAERNLHLQEGK
jgi:hypothetical protein